MPRRHVVSNTWNLESGASAKHSRQNILCACCAEDLRGAGVFYFFDDAIAV
jgi:hypothetical protein